VNNNDRFVAAKIIRCLNKCVDLYPSNPCDIKKLAANAMTLRYAHRELAFALTSLRYGDYEDANEEADKAMQVLGLEQAL